MAESAEESAASATRARRRGSEARVDHQPGVVLHTTPWRETSLIVEAFTRDYGRVGLVARGAKRPTSQYRGLLAPFAPISLSWSGRADTKNLVRVEWVGGLAPLRGNALLAGFYANELLVRLLARSDPHERLFESYLQMLRGLAEERQDVTLRTFEMELLREVGYAVPLDQCTNGEPIDATARYRFRPEAGAHRIGPGDSDEDGQAVSGTTLLAMARGDFSEIRVASEAKTMLRHLIRYHLEGKPLNTRRILLDLHEL
ncbi:MAG TPA: DNA repair protein RecO [Burkholderiaceae bacterium]|nr:DNA repair protein RecO [Burkholderiaceae bacterium]